MAARRPTTKQRVTPARRDGDNHDGAAARALADATACISGQSGRLDGEDADGATAADAAHWIAVYSDLLAFKAELLEITRRLREWRAQVATGSPVTPGTPTCTLFVEGRARTFGHLLIDPWKRTVVNHGRPQRLTPGEWQLLRTFLEHPGETLSRAQLAAGVRADGFESPFGQVAVYVSRLRRKLESANGGAPLIETVRGRGYRLTLPLHNGDLVAGSS